MAKKRTEAKSLKVRSVESGDVFVSYDTDSNTFNIISGDLDVSFGRGDAQDVIDCLTRMLVEVS